MAIMAVTPIDRELLKLISQLDSSQKTSLINFIKPFLTSSDLTQRQTIDEYNSELELTKKNVEKGHYISIEDLEKEIESW